MKKLYFIIFFPICIFAQVGVNTENPQQTLHVAGSGSIIKIDGLNEENNEKNLGAGSKTRVFVDPDGDLVLGTTEDNIILILDSENYIKDNDEEKVVQTGTGENFEKLNEGEPYPEVVMAADGIMEINYSLSWQIFKTSISSGARIDDKAARTVRTVVYVYDVENEQYLSTTNADNEVVEQTFAITGQFYANGNENHGAEKFFYNTGTDYIQVPAGTYKIIFGALLNMEGNDNVKVYFGGAKDQMQIVAHF